MITLEIDHPNRRNVESFLNSWSEPFEWLGKHSQPYTLRSTISHIHIEILFFNSQDEGFAYGEQNYGPTDPTHRWGMNGGFLYAITGPNPDLVGSLAGHFAGRE